MTIGKKLKAALADDFSPAKSRLKITPGHAVRLARELQQMSQLELAKISGIPQSAISAIELGRVTLGVERAKKLARALKVHPAVLVFPDWQVESAA